MAERRHLAVAPRRRVVIQQSGETSERRRGRDVALQRLPAYPGPQMLEIVHSLRRGDAAENDISETRRERDSPGPVVRKFRGPLRFNDLATSLDGIFSRLWRPASGPPSDRKGGDDDDHARDLGQDQARQGTNMSSFGTSMRAQPQTRSGLQARWLLRDTDTESAGYSLSLWNDTESFEAYWREARTPHRRADGRLLPANISPPFARCAAPNLQVSLAEVSQARADRHAPRWH